MLHRMVVALVMMVTASANAGSVYTIKDDKGGSVDHYRQLYASLKEAKATIVIDGVCASACGLVFSLVGQNKMCATDKAMAGFHKASVRSSLTGALLDAEIFRAMADQTTIELFTALPLSMQQIVPLADWPDVYEGASARDAVWIGPQQMQQILGKCE